LMNFFLHPSTVASPLLKIQPFLEFQIDHIIRIMISMKKGREMRLLNIVITIFLQLILSKVIPIAAQQALAKLH
jgi:hypothetical protein